MADALKAGSFDDLANTMTGEIEAAMREEWRAAKDQELPGGPGEEDRRILFAAVAKGVLRYLYAHRDDLITDNERDDSNGHRHHMAFDLREKT